jgi:MFS family permease
MQKSSEGRFVLAMVMTGVFLSTMDSGMMNVALPTILSTFSLTLQEAEFLVSIYLGTITVSLVFWGRLADSLGRGRVYLLGVVIFAMGSLCCYTAPTFSLLLASRFLQALGAAMMMATGPALIKTVFPSDHLGRSLGLVGIATACGLLSGPLISGLILHHGSWRHIFLVSLPVCLLVVLFARAFGLQRLGVPVAKEKSAFDWLGSGCWVALVVMGLTLLHRLDHLFAPANLLMALIWVLLLWCFVRVEVRAAHPILPLQLLRQRYYWVAVLTAALSFATMFIVLVVTPFYLTYALQLPVKEVGKMMTAVPAMLILLSPVSGRLYDKIGARFLTTAGLGLCCLALLGLASLNGESELTEVALFLALLGAGQSVFLTPNSASVLSQVDELWVGITAGILATARNFGMVIGATLAAWLLSWWFTFYSGGMEFSAYTASDQGAFVLAVKTTYLFAACLALLGGVFSARRA